MLGEAVALLRDMLNPDDLVVGGQAFTEYPEGMSLVEAAYAERSVLPARDIRVTAFGNRVQEAGAGVVSLGGLYSDPIGAMRRARSRRRSPPDAAPTGASRGGHRPVRRCPVIPVGGRFGRVVMRPPCSRFPSAQRHLKAWTVS